MTDQEDNNGSSELKHIVEAALLASDGPLSLNQLKGLFIEAAAPNHAELRDAIEQLVADYETRGIEVKEVASGYRMQVRSRYMEWISRLWQERPPRYSRALLETLAIIAYRQPVTRGEIEHVRGVAVSTNIVRTLQEREWIQIVGHRDVPGKPALLGTTKVFLDYFNLKSLDDLPTLAEIRDFGTMEPELELVHSDKAESPGAATVDQDSDTDADANEAPEPAEAGPEARLEDSVDEEADETQEIADKDEPNIRLVASNEDDAQDDDYGASDDVA